MRRDGRHDSSPDSVSAAVSAAGESHVRTSPRSSLILLLLAALSFAAYLWSNDVIRTLRHEIPELLHRFRAG